MIGKLSLVLSPVIVTIAAGCFFGCLLFNKYMRDQRASRLLRYGQRLFTLAALCVGVAAGYLLFILLNDRFEFSYVFRYSSRDLAFMYKMSAFWAGQEGSFLLWALFHALFGMVLVRRISVAGAGMMGIYSLLQATLLFVLLLKSPFAVLPAVQPDGAGLNPLLQDFWMTTHPPVVFLGYAGLAVPFAMAVAGLAEDRHDWLDQAMPWTLFSWSVLGAGIFIGGFWAYKILGWGGYWAWDPVENSSLVPWLVACGLLHVLLLARRQPAALKLTYFLAILSFGMVLYGIFLTRSGILADFSTHSFGDEGIGGVLGLLTLAILFSALTVLVYRWTALPAGLLGPAWSKTFLLAAATVTLIVEAGLVFAGMSTPLVSLAFGQPQSIQAAYYNATSLPVAAVLVLLLATAPLVKWSEPRVIPGIRLIWVILPLLLGSGVAYCYKLSQPVVAASLCFGLAAIAANIYAARRRLLSLAAAVSHCGAAALIIGILISTAANQTISLEIYPGRPVEAFGYHLLYGGQEQLPEGRGYVYNLQVGQGSSMTALAPLTRLREGVPAVREPAIYRGLLADLYIAPQEDFRVSGSELSLRKGEFVQNGELGFRFVRFRMNDQAEQPGVQVLIEVSAGQVKEEIRPELTVSNGRFSGKAAEAMGRYQVSVTGIDPASSQVTVFIRDPSSAAVEPLQAELSRKPLINLVWMGTVLITLGGLWAGWAERSPVAGRQRRQGRHWYVIRFFAGRFKQEETQGGNHDKK